MLSHFVLYDDNLTVQNSDIFKQAILKLKSCVYFRLSGATDMCKTADSGIALTHSDLSGLSRLKIMMINGFLLDNLSQQRSEEF